MTPAAILDHGPGTLPPSPVPLTAVPVLVAVYLAAALAEEVGWTTYLTDRLLREPSFGLGHVIDFIRVAGFPAVFR